MCQCGLFLQPACWGAGLSDPLPGACLCSGDSGRCVLPTGLSATINFYFLQDVLI